MIRFNIQRDVETRYTPRFNIQRDVETLYTPQGSQSHQDRDLTEKQFTTNTSENFVEYQLTRPPLGVDVIFSDTDKFQTSDSMNVIQRLAEPVRNVTIQSNGNNLKYENICAKSGGSCVVVGEFATMAEFWGHIRTKLLHIQTTLTNQEKSMIPNDC